MQHVKNNSITLLSDTFHLAVLKIIPIAKAIPHRVGKACISPGCSITKCGAVSASIINKHCINLTRFCFCKQNNFLIRTQRKEKLIIVEIITTIQLCSKNIAIVSIVVKDIHNNNPKPTREFNPIPPA